MNERTIVSDLINSQADEEITLIAGLVAAIHRRPHDCLGVCGFGVAAVSFLLLGKDHCDFFMSINSRKHPSLVIVGLVLMTDAGPCLVMSML